MQAPTTLTATRRVISRLPVAGGRQHRRRRRLQPAGGGRAGGSGKARLYPEVNEFERPRQPADRNTRSAC